jgi:ribose-phosphate pyrophosphokinase
MGPAFEKRLYLEEFCNNKLGNACTFTYFPSLERTMRAQVFTCLSTYPKMMTSPPPLPLLCLTETALERARATRLYKAPSENMELKLIYGNSNHALAREVAARLGVAATEANVTRFNDGETAIQIQESVRNTDVYILQPTCSSPGASVNDNLMELLLLISAARRASASRVTAVVPYYGYARQDRKDRSRVPISAADVARMIETMGADRVIAVDLHCAQIQGFFGPRTPVDNLFASPIAWSFFKTRNLANPVIVSPDAGGVTRAKRFRDGMSALGVECSFAVIIKQREQAGKVGSMDLVGNVKDCDCIIVDDMIDTAGTLCKAAEELRNFGATRVFAFASHGLFNEPAASRIEASVLEEVVVSNTIPLRKEVIETTKKIRQISVTDPLFPPLHILSHDA